MKRLARRLLLLSPLLAVLLLAGAYLLLDAWLDSAGGRRAVENALAQRLGLPVQLSGRFNVMLLPSIGVSGTELVIGTPGAATEAVRSESYVVALALVPLLNGELLVESFELENGRFYPERLPETGASDAGDGTAAPLHLPEIRVLSVSDFDILLGAGEPVRLQRFAVQDFVAGADAAFQLAVSGYGEMDGKLNWNASDQALAIDADWSELLPGGLRVQAVVGLGAGNGSVNLAWSPDRRDFAEPGLRLALAYVLVPGGARFDDLRLAAGNQTVAGAGCVVVGETTALHLDLVAPAIDFDALPDLAALGEALGSPGEAAPRDASSGGGLGLNLRLRAEEARLQGALARQAEFRVGGEPTCEGGDSPPGDSPERP